MTTKEPYSYVVLRYVHDILTGEFVNVGLVVVVPGQPLILTKARKILGRIRNIFPDLDSKAYKRAIEAIERGMKSVERGLKSEGLFKGDKTAGDYARIALPLDDSSLQWSPVGAGLTSDPQKTFDQLYYRFITRYDRPSQRRRSDEDVWRPVEAKLKEQGVQVVLESRRVSGSTDAVDFQHARKNGRLHVYEPLSFDLSDADNIKNKARRWLGHLSAVKVDVTEEDEDVLVHFLVGRPQNEPLIPAYENAIEILRQVPFENRVFEDDQIDDFVLDLMDEVRHDQGRVQYNRAVGDL